MKKQTVVILAVVLSLFLFVMVISNLNKRNNNSSEYQEELRQEEITGKEQGKNNEEPIYCTQDVMKCPDGSYVGREPPDCNFKKCPETKFEVK